MANKTPKPSKEKEPAVKAKAEKGKVPANREATKPVVVAKEPRKGGRMMGRRFEQNVEPEPIKLAKGAPQLLRGFKDILPAEQPYWRLVKAKIQEITDAYGYDCIDTPILEETNLYNRSAGKQSDVVEKELFNFEDRGGENVALRPEGTAGVARAFNTHGMLNMPQPVKLHYVGPMFRYDRPQNGRYRQHHQFGAEVFGEAGAAQDAEMILIAHLFLKEAGLKTLVRINSLGEPQARTGYLAELSAYYRSHRSQICEDCKRRLAKNPLRLLDCKEPGCVEVKGGAPHLVDYLDDDSKNHLMRVLEHLDDLQVPYVLDPHLVRGLDYYTRTVFEIVQAEVSEDGEISAPDLNSALSLGGGGRYDNLVEQLGGRPTPACGFGIGLERVIMAMKEQNVETPQPRKPDVFLAQLGDAARRKAFNLFEEMRQTGIKAAANFSKGTLKGQLEVANRLGAAYTLILGQQEIIDGTILIRDMESGMQEIVDSDKVVREMRKKLDRK
jgi:histidyl-tRNA synthetase